MKYIILIFIALLATMCRASMQDDAQAQYLKLVDQKMITGKIVFSDTQDQNYIHTPGYAVFDFDKHVCTIFLNDKAIKKNKFDDAFSFRFMVYHEMSHCELYARPHTIMLLKVKPEWQKMASDVIHLEFFHSSMGRVNGYKTYHEIFADIMAISMMKQADNETDDALAKIMAYRAGNAMAFMDNHDSANAIKKYLTTLDNKTPYESAKIYAEEAIEEAFFKKVFKKNLTDINIKELLDGTIRTAKSQDTAWSSAEEISFIKTRISVLKNATAGPWKAYAEAHASNGNAEQVITLFYAARTYQQ